MLSDCCTITDLNWITDEPILNKEISAKFRYRQKDNKVKIVELNENEAKIIFLENIKAVTPGQAAVFYDGDICLGGGLIDKIYYKGKER